MKTIDRYSVCRIAALAIVTACSWRGILVKSAHAAPRGDGQLTIEVVEGQTGQQIAARMHLKNARGRPLTLRLPGTAEFGGHFYIDGALTIPLRIGQYTFQLDAGPEYRTQSGHFEIERHADDSKRIEMKRFAKLGEEGWYGGDLDVARPLADMPLVMRAEGLNIVPVRSRDAIVTATRREAREESESPLPKLEAQLSLGPFAQLVATAGGDLLLFNPSSTIEGADSNREWPLSQVVLREARKFDARIVARTPYAWDFPMWLAGGEIDAIQLIHHHALHEGVVDNEHDGRPRDQGMFPGSRGNGRWSESVYYHALNCGFRIPPVAGSGSGTNRSPVGTNRVYAHCADDFSPERWWDAVEAGRVVVTNGPLLRPMVEGHAPGYVFHLDERGPLTLEVGLELATRVPVEYLQIIKNGEVDTEIRLAEWTKQKGKLPPLEFDASGWFLVRAVNNNQRTYQFASSGPYYVDQAGRPRVSRGSVRFFLDWIETARARVRSLPKLDDHARQALLADQELAQQFFERLLAQANAE